MGFRSIADMPEFMILMEFKNMGQMDDAFRRVAPLEGELETKHKSFNQFVAGDIQHALFRDFPDQFWIDYSRSLSEICFFRLRSETVCLSALSRLRGHNSPYTRWIWSLHYLSVAVIDPKEIVFAHTEAVDRYPLL